MPYLTFFQAKITPKITLFQDLKFVFLTWLQVIGHHEALLEENENSPLYADILKTGILI